MGSHCDGANSQREMDDRDGSHQAWIQRNERLTATHSDQRRSATLPRLPAVALFPPLEHSRPRCSGPRYTLRSWSSWPRSHGWAGSTHPPHRQQVNCSPRAMRCLYASRSSWCCRPYPRSLVLPSARMVSPPVATTEPRVAAAGASAAHYPGSDDWGGVDLVSGGSRTHLPRIPGVNETAGPLPRNCPLHQVPCRDLRRSSSSETTVEQDSSTMVRVMLTAREYNFATLSA